MASKILYQGEVPVPEAIVRVLEEGGIVMVFGISGGKSKYFFNALPGPSVNSAKFWINSRMGEKFSQSGSWDA